MITVFNEVMEYLKRNPGFRKATEILDYAIPGQNSKMEIDEKAMAAGMYEVNAVVNTGGSEGIYVDWFFRNIENNTKVKIGTLKTLEENIEAYSEMGKMAGMLIFASEELLWRGHLIEKNPRSEKTRVFIDMDGTLNKWEYVGYDTLFEKGFFKSRVPQEEVINAVRLLNEDPRFDVFVLTACLYENPYAYKEKNEWLSEHLPFIKKDHRLFTACGESEKKADYIAGGIRSADILVDDYSKNLHGWEEAGGTGIKLLNGINGKNGSWRDRGGLTISAEELKADQAGLVKLVESVSFKKEAEFPQIKRHAKQRTAEAGFITVNSDKITIKGHIGTWYVIDHAEYGGKKLFLLEHETYGDEAACLIVDEHGSVVLDDVWNGFSDYEEQFDDGMEL